MIAIFDSVISVVQIIGVVAFAISGAMVAVHKHADPFGVIFLGTITTVGGGITRDLLLGHLPSGLLQDWTFILVAMSVSLAVYLLALALKKPYLRAEHTIEMINNVFDALGLGVFAVMGTRIAMSNATVGTHPLVAIFIGGMISSIGGGLLRDVILREIPFVLKKHIYALAAIGGATLYYVLFTIGTAETLAVLLGAAFTFTLRILATVFHWNLPRAI